MNKAVDNDIITPLQLAANLNNVETAMLLIKKGAKLDPPSDSPSASALALSVLHNETALVTELLNRGAKVDFQNIGNDQLATGDSALATAAKAGNVGMIRLLLERGANPSLKALDGYDALALAKESHNAEAVELIQEALDKRRAKEKEL